MPLFSHLLAINTCWRIFSYTSSHTHITPRLYQPKMCRYTNTYYEECHCLAGTLSESCRYYPHCRGAFHAKKWCLGDCPTHTHRKAQAQIDRLAEEQHREFEAAARRERAAERTFWRESREGSRPANSERPAETRDGPLPSRNPAPETRRPSEVTNADYPWLSQREPNRRVHWKN